MKWMCRERERDIKSEWNEHDEYRERLTNDGKLQLK